MCPGFMPGHILFRQAVRQGEDTLNERVIGGESGVEVSNCPFHRSNSI